MFRPKRVRRENKKDVLFKRVLSKQLIRDQQKKQVNLEDLLESERKRQIQSCLEGIYDEQKNHIERTLTKIKQVFYTRPVHFK